MEILEIHLDRSSETPVYQQLYQHLSNGIRSGKLTSNEKLPSRRTLSGALGVSINTVMAAYQMLEKDGYIMARPASGFYVRADNAVLSDLSESGLKSEADYVYNFSQNTVELSHIPQKKLATIYRDALYDHPDLFGHGEKMGDLCLRRAVTKYLFAVRGIQCSEDQILIGAGRDYLLMCLCRVLGLDKVYGLENPCYARTHFAIHGSAVQTEILNIGLSGLKPELVQQSNADILCLMPNHQYPTAYIMGEEDRLALLDWADEEGRYIIEDDYDGEFLFTKRPPRPLFSLDRAEKVILLGDFERSIAPAVKIAYMVLPKKLAKNWTRLLPYYYSFASRTEQFALAQLIEGGHAIRHVKALAGIYRQKRDVLISALQALPFADRLSISGTEGGTHILVRCQSNKTEAELKASALAAGVKLIPLSACLTRSSGLLPDNTFIFGYGGLTPDEITAGIRALETVWRE